jgi:hypothetical protein
MGPKETSLLMKPELLLEFGPLQWGYQLCMICLSLEGPIEIKGLRLCVEPR